MLEDLLRLTGAGYSCLVDQISGEVLADSGNRRSSTTEVVEWAVAVALLLNASGMEELGDVMITSRRSHHLVRRVAPVGARPLLVVLVLDRAASNLAAARRELAAPGVSAALSATVLTSIDLAETADSAAVTPHPAPTLPERAASPRTVPPRTASPPHRSEPGPPVLRRPWANDLSTMRRLLTGLRRLL